jgi:hypothetical protein
MLLCAGCAPVEFRFADERIDLGAVLAGELNLKQVELISRGEHPMKLAGTSSNNPGFALQLSPDTVLLAPNDISILTVNHTPPVDTMEQQSATLRAWTEDGLEATLEVTSQPVTPECDLPEAIEFGAVKVGESLTLELPLGNSTPLDSAAEVDPVVAQSGSYVAEFGRFAIHAGAERKLPITFQPRFTAEFTGALTVRRHLLCKPQRVALRGTGVTSFITPTQSALAWSTMVGSTETQLLVLENRALTPVGIFDVQVLEGTSPSQNFHVVRFPLRIPAAQRSELGQLMPGLATIEISFTALAMQNYSAELRLNTDLAAQPIANVVLFGTGRL